MSAVLCFMLHYQSVAAVSGDLLHIHKSLYIFMIMFIKFIKKTIHLFYYSFSWSREISRNDSNGKLIHFFFGLKFLYKE